ncbi:MAG: restriction endonuclease [Halochromatium sp.]
MKQLKGPQFVQYFGAVIAVLRQLGGSGTPGEVTDGVAELVNVPESVQEETLASGESRFKNQAAWARFYLAKAGLIDASKRGIWALTPEGITTSLSHDDALSLFKQVRKDLPVKKPEFKVDESEELAPEEAQEHIDHRAALLDILQKLPPEGFEKICQRLLRESGFQQVVVTGKSGDGGIDGHGILEINPFVSFKVLFQCKRYAKGPVSSGHIRDFRGAMAGRADKGIIITTGNFTAEAKKEARRDGVPPIELVDGQKMVEMFESLRLGLIERLTFDVDEKFFEAYH